MDISDSEKVVGKFVWKRNVNYDILLLSEVNSVNPYASNNQKPSWTAVAKSLQDGELKMKVTDRSCRERVAELLKSHRKNENKSYRASGISESGMSELNELLTSVAKLEETKPNKQLKALYSDNDKSAAEAIRADALQSVSHLRKGMSAEEREQLEIDEYDASIPLDGEENGDRSVSSDREKDKGGKRKAGDETDKNFEFGPKKGRFQAKPSTSKDAPLLAYLEKKSEKEISLRKEELVIRQKELSIKEKEVENKTKELELARLKAEAEAEDRKKITELLIKLAAPK